MRSEPAAVIGMSCRFPGCFSPQAFWSALKDGRRLVSDFSREELSAAGTSNDLLADDRFVRSYGFLEGTDLFDPAFFGIPKREADILDPQHRVFLECCVEAIHDARLEVKQEKARTAVFAGCLISNYLHLNHQDGQLCIEEPDQFLLELANDKDFLPLRASYLLGLSGPSVNVNAGCATSLVALHLACQSLRSRECDIAIAGAASIRHYRPTGYLYRDGGILSPDGRCRPFAVDARGTVFGDGVACVVVKRLDDALKDGDRIYGLILGSAINNDGRERPSFAAPSVSGQSDVIAAAYRAAGINPETISYVEAHGTGTPLGDRVEMQALTSAFRQFTTRRDFCGLGSVKSNCGHLDAAAGMAGLFKTLLALDYDGVPATLDHNSPNPLIDFRSSPFHVVTEFTPWPRGEHQRRAGLSSFGMGGVNVHMVLEEPPARALTSPSKGTGLSDPAPITFNRVRCWAGPGRRSKRAEDMAMGADNTSAKMPKETRTQTDWRSWLYAPAWREHDQPVSTSASAEDLFVILGAEHPVATELIDELRCSGATQCSAINMWREMPQSVGGATFVDTDELISKVREITKGHTSRRLNVVDFGFADFRRVVSEDAVETAFSAYMRALSLIRQLALEFTAVPVAVTLVTAGANSVLDGEGNNPTLALTLGPILVAPQEYSNLVTRNIDLPEVISAHEWKGTARTLLRVIISAENNPQIAVRGEKSYVQEFTALRAGAGNALIEEGGVYLILGGIGSVGPAIASAMLGAGAKQVVVTRRTALSEQSIRADGAGRANAPILTEFGPSIAAASVDVNDHGALSSLVDEIASTYGRIDGMVHAAAIPGGETFEFMAQASEANFLKQAAPKINGAINLFKILSDRPGTFCLFLSSLASQLGGLGFCAYCGISNFVDAFVTHCRTRYGLPWTTINLDNWVLLPDKSQSVELFGNSSSIPRLTTEEGERIFSHLFSFSIPGQVLVSKQDLDGRMSKWRRPLGKTPSAEKSSETAKTTFAGAGKGVIKQTLVAFLKEILEVTTVDEQASFHELGGDSLQAIEILEAIRETYGVNLEMFELVNASRLDDLVAAIVQRLSSSSNAETGDVETIKETNQKLVVTLRRSSSAPNLFLVHPHGGGVSCYRALVTQLKYRGAIYGIRIPGLYGECDLPASVEQMAHAYVQAIKGYQPHGPYLIGGFSAGGIIAFEICRQLGDDVSQLIMIDTLAPHHVRELAQSEWVDEATFLAEVFLGMIDLPAAKLREFSDSEARTWAVKEWAKAGLVADSFSVENLDPIRRVFYAGLRVYGDYEPPRSSFERMLFIKCIDQPPDDCYREDDLGWGKYIRGNLVTRRVPGSHSQLMSPEYVSELARQIDESLEGIYLNG